MTEYFDYPYEATTFSRGHNDDCWKWHMECARAEVIKLNKLLDNWEAYADVSSAIMRQLRIENAKLKYEIAEWEGYTKYYESAADETQEEPPW